MTHTATPLPSRACRAPRLRWVARRTLVATAALLCISLTLPTRAMAQGAAGAEWVDWTSALPDHSRVTGTLVTGGRTVGITFEGVANNSFIGNLPEPYFGPSSTYQSSLINGAPPLTRDLIVVAGGPGTSTYRISFSEAVTDPILAIVSLGLTNSSGTVNIQSGIFFNQPVEVLSNGANYFADGRWTPFTVAPTGSELFGVESSGVVRFRGTFTEISWTSPLGEFNEFGNLVGTYMFTFGTAGCLNYEQRMLTADTRVLAGCNAYTTPGPEFFQQRRLDVQGRLRSQGRYVLTGDLDIHTGGQVDLFAGGRIAASGHLDSAGLFRSSGLLEVAGSWRTAPGGRSFLDGGLVVEPLGVVVLQGIDRIVGPISVNGLLAVGHGGNLGLNSPVLLDGNGAALEVRAGGFASVQTSIEATGNARVQVDGQLQATNLRLQGATLTVGSGGTMQAVGNTKLIGVVANAGTLEFGFGTTEMLTGSLTNSGTLRVNGNTVTMGVATVLTNASTGRVVVDSGSFVVGDGFFSSAGAVQVAGGSFTIAGGSVLSNGSFSVGPAGRLTLVGGLLDNGGELLVEGGFESGGLIRNSGRLQLRPGDFTHLLGGVLNNTGEVELSARTLGSGFGMTGTVLNNGVFTIQGGTRVLNEGLFSNNGTLNVRGFLSLDGGGGIVQSPTGRLVVDGELSTAAGLRVDGGSFSGTGTVTGGLVIGSGTVLLPGASPGTLTVDGPLTLESGAQLELEIDRRGAHDRLVVQTFTAEPGSTVRLLFAGDATPELDQSFDMLRVSSGAAVLDVLAGVPGGVSVDRYVRLQGGAETLALAFTPNGATRLGNGEYASADFEFTIGAGEVRVADEWLDDRRLPLRVDGTLGLRRDAVLTAGPVWVGASGRLLSSSTALVIEGPLVVQGEFANRGQAQAASLSLGAGARFANEAAFRLVAAQGFSTALVEVSSGAQLVAGGSVEGASWVDNAGRVVVPVGGEWRDVQSFAQVTAAQLHVDGRLQADAVSSRGLVSGRGRIDAPLVIENFSCCFLGSPRAVLRPGSEDGLQGGTLTLGRSLTMGFGSEVEFLVGSDGTTGQLVLEDLAFFGDGTLLSVVLFEGLEPVNPLSMTLIDWSGSLEPIGLRDRLNFGGTQVVLRGSAGDSLWAGGSWAMTVEDHRLTVLLTPVPEPKTYGLMLAGLGVVAWLSARRRSGPEAKR